MEQTPGTKPKIFTRYQIFVITILALIQFTVVLDFMVMSPMGTILMDVMDLSAQEFSWVVSAYAISAGISGFLSASFADKFDRKKLLLVFYSGFVLGTLFCGLAPTFWTIFAARIFTGIFGGVMSSISFAIITDLFPMQVRGRVMGFVQMAFAVSQILGVPTGLYLATKLDWHAPFLMIVALCIPLGLIILAKLQPVTAHLAVVKGEDRKPLHHLLATIRRKDYLRAFAAVILMATGGFMLMPFGSDFTTHNIKIPLEKQIPIMSVVGLVSLVAGPFIGKFSDRYGKFRVFLIGSTLTFVMVLVYTHLGPVPIWLLTIINVFMMTGVSSRMISGSALMTAVPDMKDRGAFMAINSSVQYLAGGVSALIAGLIVVKQPDGHLERFDKLGYVIAFSMIVMIPLMYTVNRYVTRKMEQVEKKAA